MVKACNKIIEKGKKIAAHMLEAAESDIEFKEGQFKVAGTDKSVSMGQVAFTAYVPHSYPQGVEPRIGLLRSPSFTYPSGSYVCEVEVDPATGVVRIERFVAVDDFGNVVNPMIVEGQVHGGLAQGIGQALIENALYDEGGQLIHRLLHGLRHMPRADMFPQFEVVTARVPPAPPTSSA
ncbi:MAG: molybdopterin cofactor-binding domain-containing protein [Geminicoccaceae bacterium]